MNPITSNGNKFKCKFENVDELTFGGKYSDKFTFQNVDWKIYIYDSHFGSCVSICLCYESENKIEETWICETKSVFKIFNQNDNGRNRTINDVAIFDVTRQFSDRTFLEWKILESEGCLKDNSIIVEIEFDFKFYDFSKNIPNHIIFKVEDSKFYVNKEILCSESEYFHNKFVVEKSNEKELEFKCGVKYFRHFIASVCLFFEIVNENNYKQLNEMATEYKTARLHNICAKFLISEFVQKMVEYADKHDYNELIKIYIDSFTTIAQFGIVTKSMKFKNLTDTTKRTIEEKMLEIVSELQTTENEQIQEDIRETCEAEKQLECQSCSTVDLEENLNICQTCNEQNLEHFESVEEVLKIAICPTCAIKKHIRHGHTTIDFSSLFLDCKIKYKMKTVEISLDNFENMTSIRKGEEQTWKTLNDAAKMRFNELIKLTRESKATQNLEQNIDTVNSFIKTTTNQTERYVEIMRAQTMLIQENLQNMEKWIAEKKNECVSKTSD